MLAVVDYHKGNLRSVERGLTAVGAEALVTDDPAAIRAADGVVLPGVGAFGDAMATMDALGQSAAVREAVEAGKPFLGICLGMHLLFEVGTESANGEAVAGLGLIPGTVERLPREDAAGRRHKIPHVGWNTVEGEFDDPLFEGLEPGVHFYFTHSYRAPESAATIARTTHSIAFPSAVRCGERAYGVQFHPEKSSDTGRQLLRNFVRIARS